MKKLLLALSTCTMLLLLAHGSMSAQNPDLCLPDCDSSDFGATQTIILTLPSGCIVRVEYASRSACDIWNDVGIISIEYLFGCDTVGIQQGVDETTEALLAENPMAFPMPDTNTCVFTWRVVRGACWKDSVDCDDDTRLVPCFGEACCLSRYRICRDSLGVITVEQNGVPTTSGECDTLDPHCVPICEPAPPSASQGSGPDLGFHSKNAVVGATLREAAVLHSFEEGR